MSQCSNINLQNKSRDASNSANSNSSSERKINITNIDKLSNHSSTKVQSVIKDKININAKNKKIIHKISSKNQTDYKSVAKEKDMQD